MKIFASSDERDLYFWRREQAALQLAQDFERLGHHETAESWRKEAKRCKEER